MNGLSERVEVIESFLGNVSDNGVSVDVPIYAIGEPRNVGGITSIPKGRKEIKTVNVNIEDIDYMVYVNQWDRVDLVKLDVEGNEISALRGAEKTIKEYRPILYLENNTCDIPPDDNNPDGRKSDPSGLIEYLVSLDYLCYWHHPSIFTGSEVVSHNMLCFHKDDERLSGSDTIVFMR
jgi:FkbM family methyltransferase